MSGTPRTPVWTWTSWRPRGLIRSTVRGGVIRPPASRISNRKVSGAMVCCGCCTCRRECTSSLACLSSTLMLCPVHAFPFPAALPRPVSLAPPASFHPAGSHRTSLPAQQSQGSLQRSASGVPASPGTLPGLWHRHRLRLRLRLSAAVAAPRGPSSFPPAQPSSFFHLSPVCFLLPDGAVHAHSRDPQSVFRTSASF